MINFFLRDKLFRNIILNSSDHEFDESSDSDFSTESVSDEEDDDKSSDSSDSDKRFDKFGNTIPKPKYKMSENNSDVVLQVKEEAI